MATSTARKAANLRWAKNNLDKRRLIKARYLKNNYSGYLLGRCRASARKYGRDITITREWVEERLALGKCEVTGLPFRIAVGERSPYSPSIDRKNTDEGYTPENCQVIVWMLNAAKGNWSMDDVMVLASTLTKRN